MYISEFWVGVGVTLFCEFALICLLVIVSNMRSKKDEDNDNTGNE